MTHQFETSNEIVVDASPEEVWNAIATGPGIDSWFMGKNDVEPREGGAATTAVGDLFTMTSTVTAYDAPRRYATRGEGGPMESFHAFEFLVEARGQGATAVRFVHSGVLGGDNWESEYDALRKGDPMYLGTLGVYLEHFRGHVATPVIAWAPHQDDEDAIWDAWKRGLSLSGDPKPGTPAAYTLEGRAPVQGVVEGVQYPNFLSVRTDDAIMKFVGRGGDGWVGHHVFAQIDRAATTAAWQDWLNRLFAA